jgi:hypothetical protein
MNTISPKPSDLFTPTPSPKLRAKRLVRPIEDVGIDLDGIGEEGEEERNSNGKGKNVVFRKDEEEEEGESNTIKRVFYINQ